MTATSYQRGGAVWAGGGPARGVQSITESASAIVSQFSQAKFPDRTSQSWVRTISPAAALATGCGVNSRKGTRSWVTWLAATSTRCTGRGRRWKNQLSGPGIGWVSWWKSRQVSSRQHASPRILISPAPNSTRNSSHRSSHSTRTGAAVSPVPRKIARNPVSSSSDSQPNPYQTCPTWTIDRYSTHGSAQSSIPPHSGSRPSRPAISATETAQPVQATAAKRRSE